MLVSQPIPAQMRAPSPLGQVASVLSLLSTEHVHNGLPRQTLELAPVKTKKKISETNLRHYQILLQTSWCTRPNRDVFIQIQKCTNG